MPRLRPSVSLGRRRVACLRALLAAAFLASPRAISADQGLWDLLSRGGQVVLIRHAVTTPGLGDPPGMRLEDCGTQRNLADEGRAHSRRVGQAFRARGIRVVKVLSSPWCRCLETARLAFVQPEVWGPLGNLFGRPENRAAQVAQMRPVVGEPPAGGNLVLVSHGSTIQALTGINPATAEMVILSPQGDGQFTIAGRLSVP